MSATTKVFRPSKTKTGYWQRLGLPDRGPRLYAALEKGFSYQVYDALADNRTRYFFFMSFSSNGHAPEEAV